MENLVINIGNPRRVELTVLSANGVKVELSRCTDVQLILWINGRSKRALTTQISNDVLIADLSASELSYLGEYSGQVKYTDGGVQQTTERVYLFRVANEFFKSTSGTGVSDKGSLVVSISTPVIAYDQKLVADAEKATADANAAKDSANTAATNANDKANLANTAANNADVAKTNAEKATADANTAALSANTAATNANTKAVYANEQGDYAKQQGLNAVATANEAATNANNAAFAASQQAAYAKQQGDYAKQEAQGIDAKIATKADQSDLVQLEQELIEKTISEIYIQPTQILENKQVNESGINQSSLQNVAIFDVSSIKGMLIKAWVSTNPIVGYRFLLHDGSYFFESGYINGGSLYDFDIPVPENAKELQFSYFKEHGIIAKTKIEKIDPLYKKPIENLSKRTDALEVDNNINKNALKKLPAVTSSLGNMAAIITCETLTNNIISITDYPRYVKKEFIVDVSAKVDLFKELRCGVGYTTTRGLYLKVNETEVSVIMYINSKETVVATQSHGLTVSEFIKINVEFYGDGIRYIINTLSGKYIGENKDIGKVIYGSASGIQLYDVYGYSFVQCGNETSLSNVQLKRTDKGMANPVWVFGDSYCSTDDKKRFAYYLLNEYYVKKFYLIALSGQTSNDLNGHVGAYNDLVNALKYATPKYLLYLIQANDTNATYSEYITKVSNLCEEKGITLIAIKHAKMGEQAIGKDWQAKNNIMLEKGIRYIDFYNAVTSSEATNEWYSGYLSSDNVHPTELGAMAEASQFLHDFPEIISVQ